MPRQKKPKPIQLSMFPPEQPAPVDPNDLSRYDMPIVELIDILSSEELYAYLNKYPKKRMEWVRLHKKVTSQIIEIYGEPRRKKRKDN
ncbi:MAG: hypothetical protein EBX41_02065 [Chitinophagia bacterium]|nr:hypothetical protein [Chitinophagia bacterium]